MAYLLHSLLTFKSIKMRKITMFTHVSVVHFVNSSSHSSILNMGIRFTQAVKAIFNLNGDYFLANAIENVKNIVKSHGTNRLEGIWFPFNNKINSNKTNAIVLRSLPAEFTLSYMVLRFYALSAFAIYQIYCIYVEKISISHAECELYMWPKIYFPLKCQSMEKPCQRRFFIDSN